MSAKQFIERIWILNEYLTIRTPDLLRLLKAKYEHDMAELEKDFGRYLGEHLDFVHEIWPNIKAYTASEALQEQNLERRRVMFDYIGMTNLFKELDAEVVDVKVINFKNYLHPDKPPVEIEDRYELLKLPASKVYPEASRSRWADPDNIFIFAVRCWCTTTGREYVIQVPPTESFCQEGSYNALDAIAWTFPVYITNPKAIFRQGDCILFDHSPDSVRIPANQRPTLTGEEYFSLLKIQT